MLTLMPTDTKMQTTVPRVAVILLNYKGVEETLACLQSLRGLNYPNFEVFIVDNHSGDGSWDRLEMERQTLQELGQPGFTLLKSEANLGYSGGNNIALRAALEQGMDYCWLLNNDTVIEPTTLTPLVAQAEETQGLVGSVLYYPDGSYQRIGTRINWLTGGVRGISEHQLRSGMAIENLTGASLLIPRRVLQDIGLLDESYFLYFEDGEYTLRALRAGFSATVATESRVFHKEGASTGKNRPATQYYYHRNRLRMLSQYTSAGQKFTIWLYTLLRLGRSALKAGLASISASGEEKRHSLKIQWLAIQDAWKGVTGPCPHDL
jgi:GT2 family glycosyltransferase